MRKAKPEPARAPTSSVGVWCPRCKAKRYAQNGTCLVCGKRITTKR